MFTLFPIVQFIFRRYDSIHNPLNALIWLLIILLLGDFFGRLLAIVSRDSGKRVQRYSADQ